MDQNGPPPPPSTTAPSDQGEHISNLSTRPNLNEQNDSYDARVIDRSHHSQSIHFGHENSHVPQKSENEQSNHSQNYNKAHSQPLIDNSNFPNLNQNISQLLPSQDSKEIKNQTQRKLQLTTFDENWQSDLKQQQAYRQQYHELFHENNELLLTQKQDDDFAFTGKESFQQDMVVEQDKRSDLSNEVQVNQFISKVPNIIYEEQSHSSQSVKEEPINPLFQNGVKDQSQTNLLDDYGFSKQSKRAPYLTWTSRPQQTIIEPAQSQNSNYIQIINNNDSSLSSFNENNNRVTSIQTFSTISQIGYKEPEQPMIIEETVQNSQSKHSSKYQSLHSSKHSEKNVSNHSNHSSKQSSKHSSKHGNQFIKIEVHNCKQQLLDSFTKNNDIYGIVPKEEANIIEKQEQPIEHSWEENIPQGTVHQEINIDSRSIKRQSQQIIFKEEQKQNYPLSQTLNHPQQQAKQQQRHQLLPQQTAQSIIQKLYSILQSNIPQQQKAQEGGKLLQKHINFLFLSPRTDIGKQILSDGKYCVILIETILMKETDSITRNILQKYLHLTFASKISKRQNAFIQYQHSSISISNVEPQQQQKPKIKQSQRSYANHTTHDTLNESVYAEHGSNAKNQGEKMVIQSVNQPIKRTVISREPVALKSQKPTRKTRLKTKGKGKGKTTAKKSAVKFEQDQIHSQVKQEVMVYSQAEKKPQRTSFRKNRQSQIILNDSFNKGDQKSYGSKFTFILRENLKREQKQLVQVRKSRRLANKQNGSEGKQKLNSRTRNSQKSPQLSSSKKKQRLSDSKRYMQQQIDINFIKANMKVLVIKNGTTLKEFQALTPLDQDIINIVNDYNKATSSQRVSWLQNQEQVEQQPQDSTNSIEYSNNVSNNVSNTNAESLSISRQQFKKKLSKYKIPNVLIINRVIDPDINNHGIYALLELNSLSQIVHGAKYVLTPITNLSRASRRLIDEDLQRAKELVKDQFDNFAFVQPSDSILKQIKKEHEKRLKNK